MADELIEIIIEPPVEVTFTVEQPISVSQTTAGANGLSAYEVAVVNGFTGTEAEWLLSLGAAVSALADNQLTQEADGLYVPPPQLASTQW